MSTTPPEQLPRQPQNRRRLARLFLSRRFLAVVCLMLLGFGLFAWRFSDTPFEKDINLVKTSRSTGMTLPASTLGDRLRWKVYEFRRTHWPDPLATTFPARAGPVPCSIHGLLSQCREVGGTEYFIEKKVASGSVNFGHTNALNGAQWIAAFQSALQNDNPEWWDLEKKGFRKENLVLLRYNKRTILVLSSAAAKEYEARYRRLRRVQSQ